MNLRELQVRRFREHIDELAAHAAAFHKRGEQANVPAVKHNAKRIEDNMGNSI